MKISPASAYDLPVHGFSIRSGFPHLLVPTADASLGLRVGIALGILTVSLGGGLLALRGKSASITQSATRLAFACLFAPGVVAVGWLDFTEFLSIPLLVSGSLGLYRVMRPRPVTVTLGVATSLALVGMQTWILVGAPDFARSLGDVLYALPLALLLLATDRLVGSGPGLTPRRGLMIYLLVVLLPDFPRAILRVPYPAVVEWIVIVAAFVGMFAVGVSFWSIDRRLKTIPVMNSSS